MSFDETDWLAYRQANLLFAEAVKKMVCAGDIVWVQDYHLCLVPLYLRDLLGRDPAGMGENAQRDINGMFDGLVLGSKESKRSPLSRSGERDARDGALGMDVQIGFFLHTPFPSSEVFR